MNRKPNRLAMLVQYGILLVFSVIALYPIWFVILASGRAGQRLYTFNLLGMFIPTEWSFENYQKVIAGNPAVGDPPFLTWLQNSFFVAGSTTVACLLIATSAAFAFSRFRFRGRELGLILFLAFQSFPGVLSLVPVAQLLTAMGLYKSHLGLILAYTSGTLVFTTYLMKGYFDTIPMDLEEAGMIDGCGPVQSFLLIALPLARPALAVTALFAFMAGWGEYILASVLVPAPEEMKTAMVGMYRIANEVNIPWGEFAAGTVIIIIPVLIVFLYLQRFLQGGLTLGGVKG
ncbi:MAG: sugar ABC transporter permease [Chloroflexi bacterium]|nr:sugar ABC transporter permease [Chloroflexota bacterium]MBI3734502.1 sugar ABC transporter permease [Chloroflexota bacterium]